MRDRTYIVTELCPHCESEIEMRWNTDTSGYKAFCPVCGGRLMLCDECLHSEDNRGCDYDTETDKCWRIKEKECSDILMELCCCKANDSINYKPYRYSPEVLSIPFKVALRKFLKDVEEMRIFLSDYEADPEKDIEATTKIWKEHVVIQ